MRFGSLFAGIGGFDLGLERAGMTCAWQVEIDDYCRRVLAKHWPHVERFEDVRECGKHNLQSVDLICGGFPCQPFSLTGKQRGADDDRYLWPEMLRVIEELKPCWVVGENVPGIINMALDDVLASLEDKGYTCETFVIPACAVNAPHRRDRVWIVGYTKSIRRGWQSCQKSSKRLFGGTSTDLCNPTGQGLQDGGNVSMGGCKERHQKLQPERPDWWAVEPDVGRVAHGVPRRVDRLRALGNAVVPQVVEIIGRAILEADTAYK